MTLAFCRPLLLSAVLCAGFCAILVISWTGASSLLCTVFAFARLPFRISDLRENPILPDGSTWPRSAYCANKLHPSALMRDSAARVSCVLARVRVVHTPNNAYTAIIINVARTKPLQSVAYCPLPQATQPGRWLSVRAHSSV